MGSQKADYQITINRNYNTAILSQIESIILKG